MGRNMLETLAELHFEKNSREPLIKTLYSGMNDENLFEFFTIDNKLVQKAVAKRINAKMQDKEFLKKVIAGLSGEADIRQKTLIALSYVQNPGNNVLLPYIRQNLQHDSAEVRKAAVRAIAYKYPLHITSALPLLKTPESSHIAYAMCYSRNTELIWPLLDFYEFPGKAHMPSWIGFLLNPLWLQQNYSKNKEAVSELIFHFGYSDCDISPEVLELLGRGFMFISREMADAPNPDAWMRRINEISRQLLPSSFEMQNHISIKLDDAVDVALFTAAVRESDIANLEAKKEQNPFDYRTNEFLTGAVVSHASNRYFKSLVIDKGIELSRELNVGDKDLGSFLIEYARAMLELNFEEAFAEEDIILRSKWLALSKMPEVHAKSYYLYPSSWPIRDGDKDNLSFARFAVINDFALPKKDERLSVGAQSTINMARYLGISGLEEKLAELELLYGRFFLPVGCEIQVPKIRQEINTSFAWKQALRYFGINSPRRPEFMEMVEAAFRPAKTFHSHILGISFLYKMGMLDRAQDMAYHISMQGELGDDERYIAFPHRLMAKSRIVIEEKDLRFKRMARLMSKGFVNLNKDVEPCCLMDEKPDCRTELRVYGCSTDEVDGKIMLRKSFIDNIISTQLLSSALKSEMPEFQSIWAAYKEEIEAYTKSLPRQFYELLHSNWHESTGDPRDGRLVGLLPIVRKREEVSSIISEKNMADELEKNLNRILGKHTKNMHEEFLKRFNVSYDFSSFAESDYGIPYIMPKEAFRVQEGYISKAESVMLK